MEDDVVVAWAHERSGNYSVRTSPHSRFCVRKLKQHQLSTHLLNYFSDGFHLVRPYPHPLHNTTQPDTPTLTSGHRAKPSRSIYYSPSLIRFAHCRCCPRPLPSLGLDTIAKHCHRPRPLPSPSLDTLTVQPACTTATAPVHSLPPALVPSPCNPLPVVVPPILVAYKPATFTARRPTCHTRYKM
jgi:hypothetical protein